MAISYDSTLKEILGCPEAVAIVEEYSPGFAKNPSLKMAYGMTMRNCCKFPQAGIPADKQAELEQRLNALGK